MNKSVENGGRYPDEGSGHCPLCPTGKSQRVRVARGFTAPPPGMFFVRLHQPIEGSAKAHAPDPSVAVRAYSVAYALHSVIYKSEQGFLPVHFVAQARIGECWYTLDDLANGRAKACHDYDSSFPGDGARPYLLLYVREEIDLEDVRTLREQEAALAEYNAIPVGETACIRRRSIENRTR